MKRIFRKVKLLFVILLIILLSGCSKIKIINKNVINTNGEYSGQVVILHTNDVHGAIEGYSYLPELKNSIEVQGGTVILVDAGDFSDGTPYVFESKGETAIEFMNQVPYDLATIGNHDFGYGYEQLSKNISKANFNFICSNVLKDGKLICDEDIIYKVGKLKIGFFALSTPETQTKIMPSLVQGYTFTENEDLYKLAQKEADKLNKKCDIVICLSHLGIDDGSTGNRSIDIMENTTGIDYVIDGHSHSVISNGDLPYPIQQTGTKFENIGLIAIDNKSNQIVESKLIPAEGLSQDDELLENAKKVITAIDEVLGQKFASTDFLLNGEKPIVRSQESNLGNLISDAVIWYVKNNVSLDVDSDHVVAISHGGGIRATIEAGDISKKMIKTVLPFGNTIAVNYVTGKELLETLEASTYCTPELAGGFPHVSGMKISIDTTKEYDAGEEYPNSTYFAPDSIQRVTINEVNGKPFDINSTYAVVTSNFCATGGDSYYAFKRAYDEGKGFDTSVLIDEAVVDFIVNELGGTIPSTYADAEGRVTIK